MEQFDPATRYPPPGSDERELQRSVAALAEALLMEVVREGRLPHDELVDQCARAAKRLYAECAKTPEVSA